MKQPVSSLLSWMGGGGGGVAADVLGSAGIVQSVLPSWSTPLTSVSMVSAVEIIPPAASVRLVKMYGRVYCVHVVAAQRRLDLYRLFTDTVALQHSYRLPDAAVTPGPSPFLLGTTDAFDGHGALTLSVVDNVLVLHLPHDGSALLFDVCADATSPVSEPQPLGHLAPLRRTRQLQEERMQLQLARQMRAAVATGNALRGGAPEPAVSGQAAAPPPLPQPTAWSVMDGGEAAQGLLLDRRHTQFHLPNLIVDSKSQVVYRLLLDLHAISKGAPSQATLAAFLQRRRAPRLHVQPVELTLGLGLPGFVLPPSPLPSANLRPPATSAPVGSLPPSPEPPSMLAERMGLQGGACSQHQPADGFSPRTPEQLKAAVSGFGVDKAAEGSASSDPGVMMAGLRHTSLGSGYGSGSPLVAPHPVMLSGVVSVGATTCKLLLLQHVQGLMQDEVPLAELRSVLDAMSKAYSELALAAASGRTTLAASACVVSPSDLVVHILAAMCVRADLPPARHRYLQAVLAELTASVATAGVRPPAALQLLGLQMVWPPCSGPAPLPPVPSPTISLTPHPASGTRHVAALGAAPAAWLQAAADGAQRDLAADAASGQPQPAQIPAAGGGSMQQGPQQLHAEVLARVLHCSLEHLSPEAQPAQIQALGADCAARGSMGAGALAVGSSARTEESTIQLRHCAVGEAAAVEAGMALLAVRARAAAGAQQNTATAAGLAVDKAGRGGSATSKPNAQSPGNFVPVRPHGQAADTAQPTSGVPEPTSDGVQGAAPAVPGAVPAPGPTPAASTPAPNQQPLAGGDGTPTGHAAASVAPATGGPQAASAAAAAGSSEPGVALVMQLLAQGRVVKAARVARELHVSQLPPSQLLLAAAQAAQPTSGHASQAGVFAAVYRSFRPALMPLHPTLEAARQAMLSV